MQSVYERLIGVLGKGLQAPETISLFDSLEESPQIANTPKDAKTFMFCQSGFFLMYSEKLGCFVSAFFHFQTGMVESKFVTPYGGELLKGIQSNDSSADVQSKLGRLPDSSDTIQGKTPEQATDVWEKYIDGPLSFTFIFDGKWHKLSSVGIWLIEFLSASN